MISEEIQQIPADARTDAQWLREIAYQLAVMNENLKIHARCEHPMVAQSLGSAVIGPLTVEGIPRQKRKYTRRVKIA